MTDKLNDEQKGRILTQIPAGRMGAPEEIGAAVLYLASPGAGCMPARYAACGRQHGDGLTPGQP